MHFLVVFCIGGTAYNGGNYSTDNKIMEFNPELEKWLEIGAMKESRADHGVSIVSYKDYEDWCN